MPVEEAGEEKNLKSQLTACVLLNLLQRAWVSGERMVLIERRGCSNWNSTVEKQ
jgi:hypothetical protein